MRNLINRWNFLQSWSNFQNVTIFYRMLVHVDSVYSGLKHSHQVHQRSIVDGGWVNKYERAPLAASFKCSGNVHKLQSVTCVMFRQNSRAAIVSRSSYLFEDRLVVLLQLLELLVQGFKPLLPGKSLSLHIPGNDYQSIE